MAAPEFSISPVGVPEAQDKDQGMASQNDALACPICMEPYGERKAAQVLLCGHSLCEACIGEMRQGRPGRDVVCLRSEL